MKRLLLVFPALALAAACGGGGGGGGPSDGAIAGDWQYVSGPIFQHPGTYPLDLAVDYLSFAKDGTGTVFGSLPSGVHGCAGVLFSVINKSTVAIDAPEIDDGSRLFRWSKPDGNTLVLTDDLGNESTFTLAASIPAASQCAVQAAATSFDLAKTPGYQSGLAFDGANLFYRDDSGPQMAAVSAANGSSIATYPISAQWRNPQAYQTGGFWMGCACGGDDSLQKRSSADALLDTLNISDLALSGSFGGVATDGATDLYIGTFLSGPTGGPHLLHVDTTATGTVLSNVAVDVLYSSLATDASGHLWGVATAWGPILAEIDETTGTPLQQFDLPPDSDWRGMAFANGSLYLVGYPIEDPTKAGVLARIDGL